MKGRYSQRVDSLEFDEAEVDNRRPLSIITRFGQVNFLGRFDFFRFIETNRISTVAV
jgi:hypothetical protein